MTTNHAHDIDDLRAKIREARENRERERFRQEARTILKDTIADLQKQPEIIHTFRLTFSYTVATCRAIEFELRDMLNNGTIDRLTLLNQYERQGWFGGKRKVTYEIECCTPAFELIKNWFAQMGTITCN